MKKILFFLLIVLTFSSLAACGSDSEKEYEKYDDILDNPSVNYYVTNEASNWKLSQSNQLNKISFDDYAGLNSLNIDKTNVKNVYQGQITLSTDSKNKVEYIGYEVNLGLVFDIVLTDNPNDEASYYKLPSSKYTFKNLTPDYLLDADTKNYCGACANKPNTYDVILIEYTNATGKMKFGLGLFPKSNTSTPAPGPSGGETIIPTDIPTINVDYDEVFDSNNGADILPENTYNLANTVQEGLILHAWNWSYKNIEKSLADIAAAGYTTVQVSPVQQPKDYKPAYGKGWAQQWWKFYQPVSFSVSSGAWLGTKDDLTSLCKSADDYGIKIIVDIVANHAANISNDNRNDKSNVSAEVKDYEPELYNNSSNYFREYIENNDSSTKNVVQGNIGMPDLNTQDPFVQGMIIDLLKECIDCGVDGFRFDAAKHIETPDDGQYASDFWPNVIGAADEYANSKNITLYHYGEILNTPGNGRSWSSYTKYMSITDNKTGNSIRQAIVSKNASLAASSTYQTGEAANKLVLWAESHDTYANTEQESTNVSQENINKTWALVAARKDATALYFARPGEVGSIGTYYWKNVEVASVNNFHNEFIGADETLYSSGNYAIVERYTSSKCGAVIVNCDGTTSNISINVKNLVDGTYYDDITGNEFKVSNGTLTGKMGSTGIVVLTNSTDNKAPIISLNKNGGFYSDSLTLEIELSFATKARVKVADKVYYIDGSSTVTIGDEIKNLQSFTVEVSAVNDKYRVTERYEFTRLDGLKPNSIVVTDVPEEYLNSSEYDLYAWVWPSGKNGREIKVRVVGEFAIFEVNDADGNFLLAASQKGYVFDWNLRVKYKTSDFLINDDGIYSAGKEFWVKHVN